MDATPDPRDTRPWRLAVWGIRVMGPGLAVAFMGLLTLLWSAGAGQVLLAGGMGVYLIGVAITITGIALVYLTARSPRAHFLQLRWCLLHDALHARSAPREPWVTGRRADSTAPPPHLEDLRSSPRWRRAVWGTRVVAGPALVIALTGLISLLWWPAGRAVLAVGIGVYVAGVFFTLAEVVRAYGRMAPPRPDYMRIHRTLLHDALRWPKER